MLIAAVSLGLFVAWLASRRTFLARAGGALLAATIVTYCGVVVFALVADNRTDLSQIKIPGLMAITVLLLTGAAAVVGWTRGARSRVG